MHGGSAPQVKEKAAQRLREGVMPMLATLYRIAHDDSVPPAVQLAAVRDWLDRAGIKEAISVEVTVQPWERLVQGVVAEVPDDQITRVARNLSGYDDVVDAEVVEDDEPLALPPTPAPPQKIPSRRRWASGVRG